MGPAPFNKSPGAGICALALVICLIGCHPQAYQSLPRQPAQPPAATPPRVTRPTLYVAINQLNLRACPGMDCPKISSLELNAEVEKMGETKNWTQIRVKKDGIIGYVTSRYLSPHPMQAAHPTKKKRKKEKPAKPSQPPAIAGREGDAGPTKQEPSPPLPRIM